MVNGVLLVGATAVPKAKVLVHCACATMAGATPMSSAVIHTAVERMPIIGPAVGPGRSEGGRYGGKGLRAHHAAHSIEQ